MNPAHKPEPEIIAKFEGGVEMRVHVIEPENFAMKHIVKDVV